METAATTVPSDEKKASNIHNVHDGVGDIVDGHLVELEVDLARVIAEDDVEGDWDADTSPFPAVRAVVPETDDPEMPVNTFRAWFLGIVFVFLGAGINQFFALRYPGVHIVSLVAELIAFPLGVALARLLPISRFNPDRHFNVKEHALITIMSNVSFGFGSADATNIIQAAKYYGFTLQTGFSVMVVLCCQLLGYGVAGLSSRWLVEPASMIWPGVLSNIALLSSMHSKANAVADGWRITRINFFMVVGGIAFLWYWLPGLMFTGLSYFTWICWIAPKNVVVNQVFGMVTGMGLFPLTFDWSMIAYTTVRTPLAPIFLWAPEEMIADYRCSLFRIVRISHRTSSVTPYLSSCSNLSIALLSPHHAALNVFVGFAFFFWIICPALYYTNVWSTGYLPFSTADVSNSRSYSLLSER